MMSKTHIAVGIASSLAVCLPSTPVEISAAIIGGSVGAILCDIECRSTANKRDVLYGRIIVGLIVVVLLTNDMIFNRELLETVLRQASTPRGLGVVVLIATCLLGRRSAHRTFTHSLLFVLLVTYGFFCLSPVLALPVLVGGISHLAIDTLNKKPVPWLYPLGRKGICLNLFYANKLGNAVLMWAALAVGAALLAWRIQVVAAMLSV